MMVFLLGSYVAILALFVWLKFIPFNTFWKVSPLVVLLLLTIGLFIPMGWGAPQGSAVVRGIRLRSFRMLRAKCWKCRSRPTSR